MAIYHLHSTVGRRKSGQSARAKSEYLARQGKYRRGADHVRHVESGNMPRWARAGRGAGRGARYWRYADQYERANAVLFRQVEAALPRELGEQQQLALARELAAAAASTDAGPLPYTLAIHDSGGGNPHVHVMLSEHLVDGYDRDPELWFRRANKKNPERGGAPKAGIGEYRQRWLQQLREQWAELANRALEHAGEDERIDHRSLAEQGIERLPQRHMGAQAAAIERRSGERTARGELYRARQHAIEHPEDTAVVGAHQRALEAQYVRVNGQARRPYDEEWQALLAEQQAQQLQRDRASVQTALEDTPRWRLVKRADLRQQLTTIDRQLERCQRHEATHERQADDLRAMLKRDPKAIRRVAAAADEHVAGVLAHRAQSPREQPQDAAAAHTDPGAGGPGSRDRDPAEDTPAGSSAADVPDADTPDLPRPGHDSEVEDEPEGPRM